MSEIPEFKVPREALIAAGPYAIQMSGNFYTINGNDLANLVERIMIAVLYLRDEQGRLIRPAITTDQETLINAALDAITAVADL